MIFKWFLWSEAEKHYETRCGLLMFISVQRMKEFVITPLQMSALFYYNEQRMRPETELMNVQFR